MSARENEWIQLGLEFAAQWHDEVAAELRKLADRDEGRVSQPLIDSTRQLASRHDSYAESIRGLRHPTAMRAAADALDGGQA